MCSFHVAAAKWCGSREVGVSAWCLLASNIDQAAHRLVYLISTWHHRASRSSFQHQRHRWPAKVNACAGGACFSRVMFSTKNRQRKDWFSYKHHNCSITQLTPAMSTLTINMVNTWIKYGISLHGSEGEHGNYMIIMDSLQKPEHCEKESSFPFNIYKLTFIMKRN